MTRPIPRAGVPSRSISRRPIPAARSGAAFAHLLVHHAGLVVLAACSWASPSSISSWPAAGPSPTGSDRRSGFALVLVVAAGLIHKLAPTSCRARRWAAAAMSVRLVAIFLEVHFGPGRHDPDPGRGGLFGLALCHDVLFFWPIQEVRGWLGSRLAAAGRRTGPPCTSRGSTLAVRARAERLGKPPVTPAPTPSQLGRRCTRRSPCVSAGDAPPRQACRRAADHPAARSRRPRASWLAWPPVQAGLAVSAAADGDARAARRPSRSRSTRPRSTPGPCCWSGRCSISATRSASSRSIPGPVITQFEIELEAGSARVADHEPGRRPGDRPGRAERADRGPDPGQDDGRHRSAQRSPQRRPAGRGHRRRRRPDPGMPHPASSWARTSRASPWSSTWPRCPTC